MKSWRSDWHKVPKCLPPPLSRLLPTHPQHRMVLLLAMGPRGSISNLRFSTSQCMVARLRLINHSSGIHLTELRSLHPRAFLLAMDLGHPIQGQEEAQVT